MKASPIEAVNVTMVLLLYFIKLSQKVLPQNLITIPSIQYVQSTSIGMVEKYNRNRQAKLQ